MKLSPTQIKEIAERSLDAQCQALLKEWAKDGTLVKWMAERIAAQDGEIAKLERERDEAKSAFDAAWAKNREIGKALGAHPDEPRSDMELLDDLFNQFRRAESDRDEAKSQNRLDEELIADLVTGMDSWAHEEDDEVYADAWEAYCNARTRLHWEFADQKPSGEPAAPTRSTLRARIAQLESLLAVKDGALRVIANGEIVLPGGTPVEIAREALKGSA